MSCSRLAASVGYFCSVCCDDGPVGVDQVAAQRHARRGGVVFAQHAAHGVAMHVQLARDGPYAPMLDRVQTLNAGGQLQGDGHTRVAPAS